MTHPSQTDEIVAPTYDTERAALVKEVGDCCRGTDPYCAAGCLVEEALRKRRATVRTPTPTSAPPSGVERVKAIIAKHRREVEQSPGIGRDVQTYALSLIDDIEGDLSSLDRTGGGR